MRLPTYLTVRCAAALAGVAVLLPPVSRAAAQRLRPSTTGFSVAATASAARNSAESQGITTSSVRVAPRAELSFGVTPRVSLVTAVVSRAAEIEDQEYDVRSVDMGMRYLGRVGQAWRSFAEGGLSVRKFSLDRPTGKITATNVGPWFAAGYMYFPGGSLALEGAATFGRVAFESWRVAGSAAQLAPVVHQEVGVRVGARWFVRSR